MSFKDKARQLREKRGANNGGSQETGTPVVAPPVSAPVEAPASISSVFEKVAEEKSVVKAVKNIPLGSIYVEKNIRDLDQETVEKYAASYRSDKSAGNMPPIRVWQDPEGRHLVVFGHHRFEGQCLNEKNFDAIKYSHIPASVIVGDRPSDELINKWRYQENKTQRGLNPVDDARTLLAQITLLGLEDSDSKYRDLATYMIGDELETDPSLTEAQRKTKIKSEVSRYSKLLGFMSCGYPDIIDMVHQGKMGLGNSRSGAIAEVAKRNEEKRLASVAAAANEKAESIIQRSNEETIAQEQQVQEIQNSVAEKAARIDSIEDDQQREQLEAEIAESSIQAEQISVAAKKKAEKAVKEATAAKKVSEVAKPKKESIPLSKDVAEQTAYILQWVCDQVGVETISFSDEPTKKELMSIFKDRVPDLFDEIKGRKEE